MELIFITGPAATQMTDIGIPFYSTARLHCLLRFTLLPVALLVVILLCVIFSLRSTMLINLNLSTDCYTTAH